VPNTGAREPRGGPSVRPNPPAHPLHGGPGVRPPYRCRSLRRSGCSASARYHVRSPLAPWF